MKKKELLFIRQLKAMPVMLTAARQDAPKKVSIRYGSYTYTEMRQKYWIFLRFCVENGILKAALYQPDALRAGGRLPIYELYIDRSARKFITYNPIRQKWLSAKLDRLEWPQRLPWPIDTWMSDADSKKAANYLDSTEQVYQALLSYQREIRQEEREHRYRRETDAWDTDMALTPDLPKDQYEPRGAKGGIP